MNLMTMNENQITCLAKVTAAKQKVIMKIPFLINY